MMEEYEVFDEYLKKSQSIRDYCANIESLLFHALRAVSATEGKIYWLKGVGKEIDAVCEFINKFENKRKKSSSGIDIDGVCSHSTAPKTIPKELISKFKNKKIKPV
ncbi:hypothetical protein [uncultured Desulfobacter sp.]|uniref:hypothetical protein n=1 Tax=uncultured Desulfobacter sp. TaxID=240139 RepID=UPI0029C92C80|nr:hypothetical protein [uncultured Desulfobacter sp.]